MARKILFVLLGLVAAAALWYFYPRPVSGPLNELTPGNFSMLRDEFNRSKESVRVVVMLSPT